MDVRMPGMDGPTATAHITGLDSPPHVVMLTTFDLDEHVHAALRAGAVGFLLKDTPPLELAAAIRTVADGNAMLSPSVTRRLIAAFADRRPSSSDTARRRLASLTSRERDVAAGIGRGLSNHEISQELALSVPTVKAHVSHLLAKLGAANRLQVAILINDAIPTRPTDDS